MVVALLACLPLMELAVRVVDPPQIHVGENALLMTAVPQRDDKGTLRFPPHLEVREVVVARGQVEYDVRFPTNNLGRVDRLDYPSAGSTGNAIAFAGDSYAMGVEGGEPWLIKLREQTGVELYNFGLGAIGIAEIASILRAEAGHLPFREMVIVAISDDFSRPVFDLEIDGNGVRFCIEAQSQADCRARAPIIQLIEPDLDAMGVLARAKAAHLATASADSSAGPLKQLLRQSKLLLFLKRIAPQGLRGGAERNALQEKNLAALAALRAALPDRRIRFVHIPDKFEAQKRRYDLALSERLKAMGIEYLPALEQCEFRPDMYYANDNHPTRDGYQHLGTCVRKILGLLDEQAGNVAGKP
jgi:hypothetical protein